MPHRVPLSLGALLLAPVLLAAAAVFGDAPAERVKKLVEQLGAAEEEKQVAAESALLKLGPDILPLLTPDLSDKSPGGVRLRSVAATLKELLPRTFTLKRRAIPLSEALKELTKQTGIAVRGPKIDPKMDVYADGLPFWKALDALAATAGMQVSPYETDGVLALVPALTPPKKADASRVSYHGMFRTAVKQLGLSRDLDAGTHTCVIHLEAAWEPRLQPFLLETGPAVVIFAKDAEGKVRKASLPSRGQDTVTGRNAHELVLRVAAPHRSSPRIDELKGTFVVTAPSKMLTFTFKSLAFISPRDKGERQVREGVSVRLKEVAKDPDGWAVEVAIDNPPGGPRFESHQAWLWLANNAIWLERRVGGTRQQLHASAPFDPSSTSERAEARYVFSTKDERNRGVAFGKITDWTLVYRTPGRIVEITVPYEFKGVPLP